MLFRSQLANMVQGEPDLIMQLSDEVQAKNLDLQKRRRRADDDLASAQQRVAEARGELRAAELFLDRGRR